MMKGFINKLWQRRRYLPLVIIAYFIVAAVLAKQFDSNALLMIGIFLFMAALMLFVFFWQISVCIHLGRALSGTGYYQLLVIIALPVMFLAATGMLYGAFMTIGLLLDLADINRFRAFTNTRDAVFGICIGLLALTTGLVAMWRVTVWRLYHIRQLGILPSSRTRSTAVGLVELQGTARSLDGEEFIPFGPMTDTRFYLEDDTGRILIDATGAVPRDEFWLMFFSQRLPEIVVHGRDPVRTGISGMHDGDPVYVLGWAAIRDDASQYAQDSERLVIRKRPVNRKGHRSSHSQFAVSPGFDLQDIFFVTDRPEAGARRILWRGLFANAAVAGTWIVFSTVCLLAGLMSLW